MIVAAGTTNPAKLEGIRSAFSKYFPELEIKAMDASSVAQAQPLGLEQIVKGAVARAKYAMTKTLSDFGVGVEAGIFKIGDVYFDHQQAAIVDRTGRVSLGHSAGFMLPSGPVEKMIRNGDELEDFAVEFSGVPQIGDKGGLIRHLTKGAMTRTDLTEQCVTTALVPWLHKGVYGF